MDHFAITLLILAGSAIVVAIVQVIGLFRDFWFVRQIREYTSAIRNIERRLTELETSDESWGDSVDARLDDHDLKLVGIEAFCAERAKATDARLSRLEEWKVSRRVYDEADDVKRFEKAHGNSNNVGVDPIEARLAETEAPQSMTDLFANTSQPPAETIKTAWGDLPINSNIVGVAGTHPAKTYDRGPFGYR